MPDITWTFQGMTNTQETVTSINHTHAESTIVITDLLGSDGGNYSCQINSTAAVMPSSREATIAVIGGKIN